MRDALAFGDSTSVRGADVMRISLAWIVDLSASVRVNACVDTGRAALLSTSASRTGRKEPPAVVQIAVMASLPSVNSSADAAARLASGVPDPPSRLSPSAKPLRPKPSCSAPSPTAIRPVRSRKSRRLSPEPDVGDELERSRLSATGPCSLYMRVASGSESIAVVARLSPGWAPVKDRQHLIRASGRSQTEAQILQDESHATI